ncbi:MAG: YggT family protein [Clostridia bacterium]|nr:YggT family protein [Clostridia bacterium]
METVTFIVTRICLIAFDFLSLAILIRVILSWIPLDEDNKIDAFFYAVTEPVIMPVRALLEKFDSISMLPIDIPLLITAVIVSILSTILSAYG